MKKIIIITSIFIFTVAGILLAFRIISPEDNWICQNNGWVKHGHPSAPMPTDQCGTATKTELSKTEPVACPLDAKLCSDGSSVGRVAPDCKFPLCPKEELIVVELSQAQQPVKSPLSVKGRARGTWYFEGDFPMKLISEDGKLIAQGIVHAQGEWMTTEFVPFEEQLIFSAPAADRGYLILEKNNPSDLEENADQLQIPVSFEK